MTLMDNDIINYRERYIKTQKQHDSIALWLLLLGGLIVFIGWIVGLVMFWRSSNFTVGQKLLGTILLPGGLLGAVLFVFQKVSFTCSISANSTATGCQAPLVAHAAINFPVLALLIIIPAATCAYLGNVLHKNIGSM